MFFCRVPRRSHQYSLARPLARAQKTTTTKRCANAEHSRRRTANVRCSDAHARARVSGRASTRVGEQDDGDWRAPTRQPMSGGARKAEARRRRLCGRRSPAGERSAQTRGGGITLASAATAAALSSASSLSSSSSLVCSARRKAASTMRAAAAALVNARVCAHSRVALPQQPISFIYSCF